MSLVLALALWAAGQTTTDVGRVPRSGPGVTVRAVVQTTDSTPLSRARITVQSAGRTSEPVFTDRDGRAGIVFPRTAYTLRITKSGYAPVETPGPERPEDGIAIEMVSAGILRGHVVDDAGRPSALETVRIQRLEPKSAPGPADVSVSTDDRGEFRLGQLVAGRYALQLGRRFAGAALGRLPPDLVKPGAAIVLAVVRSGEESVVTLIQDEPLVSSARPNASGVVTGVLVDEFGEPAEGVSVRLLLTRYGDGRLTIMGAAGPRPVDDTGRYRLFRVPAGRYFLVATPDTEQGAGPPQPPTFLPVYYPGGFEIAGATEIPVSREQETSGVDMTVVRSRGARVFGVALDAVGSPLNGDVTLVASELPNVPSPPPLTATLGPDGRFEVKQVPPGTYAIQATATIRERGLVWTAGPDGGLPRQVRVDTMHVADITEFGMQRLTVAGDDIGPLALSTAPTSTISGRVTADGPGRSIVPTEFAFSIANVDPDEVPAVRGNMRSDVTVEPTGTFRISGLTGRSRIVLSRAPAGWWLESVKVGGQNAAEEPLPFGAPGDSRDDVTIVLSDGGAELAGRVTGTGNAERFSVVVFPVDRARRISGSRYLRTTDASSDGRFALNSFPPGQYFAIAVEETSDDSSGDWENPEILELLGPLAQRVTLAERDTRTLDLPLVQVVR